MQQKEMRSSSPPPGRKSLSGRLLATFTAVMAIALVIVGIGRLNGGVFQTLIQNAPVPSVGGSTDGTRGVSAAASPNASPTPSHRATPNSFFPAAIRASIAGPHTITGTVYELDAQGQSRPVGGVSVTVFVRGGAAGGGYPWMTDLTDATGRYELWGLPDHVTAVIWAEKQSYVQPCGAWVLVADDYLSDIEIVPTALGGAAAAAAARRGRAPFLTGIVYEQRPDGARTPIANAAVALGKPPFVATTTVTDDLGRYLLCSVPVVPWGLDFAAPGYTAVPLFECDADSCWYTWRFTGDLTIVDVEMKR